MSDAKIIKVAEVPEIERGAGIKTVPLITPHSLSYAKFTTGMSVYPKGQGARFHFHNCDEQVTLLEGVGEVEVDGVITPLARYDSTYIQAKKVHAFRNTGDEPMRILWVYSSNKVTRTFLGSDEEVEHLSKQDLMAL
jgi:mannose-6-phosphate isomerase-like protein (cupin superfamily)